ncbi:MAG: hypothetical protein ACR2MP_31360 [Streptosporangiaceae bacterium]
MSAIATAQPVPVRADPVGAGGVMVSWAVHDLLELDPGREAEREATGEIMNLALARCCSPWGT